YNIVSRLNARTASIGPTGPMGMPAVPQTGDRADTTGGRRYEMGVFRVSDAQPASAAGVFASQEDGETRKAGRRCTRRGGKGPSENGRQGDLEDHGGRSHRPRSGRIHRGRHTAGLRLPGG